MHTHYWDCKHPILWFYNLRWTSSSKQVSPPGSHCPMLSMMVLSSFLSTSSLRYTYLLKWAHLRHNHHAGSCPFSSKGIYMSPLCLPSSLPAVTHTRAETLRLVMAMSHKGEDGQMAFATLSFAWLPELLRKTSCLCFCLFDSSSQS